MEKLQDNKYYWLKDGKNFELVVLVGMFPISLPSSLPTVHAENEDILKQQNIPYTKKGIALEVHDPNFVEYKGITAKVCELSNKSIVFLDETHTEQVPTENMLYMANEYYRHVVRRAIEQVKFDKYFKETTADGLCIMWERSRNALNITMSEMDRNKYYVLELLRRNTYHGEVGLVISKEALGDKDVITLNVPKHYVGLVVGRSGANVRRMAYEMALKCISVKAIQD